MSQVYIEWASPETLDMDDAIQMTAFLKEFDEKMILSGLKKIPELSFDYVHPPMWTSTPYNQKIVVSKYSYKLPKGDNKIEFENVPNEQYKKIKRASYSNSDTEIQFIFYYQKWSSAPVSGSNFKKTSIIMCEMYTRNDNTGSFVFVSGMSSLPSSNQSTSSPNTPLYNNNNRKNYIIHTEDTLILFFGYFSYSSNFINASNVPYYLISFSLKRSSNNYGHTILVSPNMRSTYTNLSNTLPLMMSSCKDNNVITNVISTTKNFYTFAYPIAAENLGGEIVIQPILNIFHGLKSINETVYTTKSFPDNPVLTEDNAVVMYKGNQILISTLNMGNSVPFVVPYSGNECYAFIVMKPNYQIIEGELT